MADSLTVGMTTTLVLYPECSIADCSGRGDKGHPYFTLDGQFVRLNLCDDHEGVFSHLSAFGPPVEARLGVPIQRAAGPEEET